MSANDSLLSTEERNICEQIAAQTDLHGQRARALLALDDGGSRAEAGTIAALSPGQVRYLMTKFRQQRLEIFPAEVLDKLQPKPESKAAKPEKTEPAAVHPPKPVEVEESTAILEGASGTEPLSVTDPPEKKSSGKKKKKAKKAKKAKKVEAEKSTKKNIKAKKGKKKKDKSSKKKKGKKKAKALKV